MKRLLLTLGTLSLLLPGLSYAIGVLVPTDQAVAPLAIESHRVEVNIKDRTAETKVVQVFKNSTNRVLEAIYTFPLPKGASVSDFALWMNGKKVSGEVLEKEKAREIYQGIVSRMKDPGLLEYVDGKIFQAKVFPIPANGTQQVEISFTSILPREGGVSQYTYPLKTGGKSAQTLKDFTLTVKLESKTPIKNVYSPSHAVYVNRKGDTQAVVGFEFDRAVLEKDFQLYYSLSKSEVGVDLLTFKRKGEEGYFMLMMSPKQDYAENQILGKHVTFVMDTSGSMSGQKMESARNALLYCLQNLRDDDTFSLIRFSSDVESFESEPKPATKEWIQKAVDFTKKMEAAGGTAIYDALQEALKVQAKNSGPHLIVFLTDGSPTIGETDPKRIADFVVKANAGENQIFVFGVGETVNTVLLDQIAADNGGFAEYARPDTEVELVLTSFYNKIAYPVLSDTKLEIPRAKTKDLFPRQTGDLYRGQQILLLGRYKEVGGSTITLTGIVDGKQRKFEYEGEFPEENLQNDFIPRLWAERKVGYLLEEIRLRGENKELKDEVVRLAKEFGIVTPYTSYLVVEDAPVVTTPTTVTPGTVVTPAPAPSVPRWNDDFGASIDGNLVVPEGQNNIGLGGTGTKGSSGGLGTDTVTGRSYQGLTEQPAVRNKKDKDGLFQGKSGDGLLGRAKKVAPSQQNSGPAYSNNGQSGKKGKEQSKAKPQEDPAALIAPDYNASTGASGVAAAKENRGRKELNQNESNGYSQNIADRTFLWNGSGWVDSTYKSSMKTMVIEPMSEAYFALLKLKPELAKILAQGTEVTVVISKDKAIVIMAGGRASIPEAEIQTFVAP